MTDSLLCANCRSPIEVSTVLASQLRDQLRLEFDAEARRKDAAHTEREKLLHDRELTLEGEIARRLTEEKSLLLQQAKTALASEMDDLQDQLAASRSQLEAGRQAELQLRKDRRDLEEQRHALELSVARTLDDERQAIRQAATDEAIEQNRLREADHDKLITDLRRQIDDLKRKSEQGSQQAQGEVMELLLEDLLRQHFPLDAIDEVPVGVHGGDLLQRVYDVAGEDCGTIIWESKRTKAWSDTWLPKLRDDQRAAKAHLAILVTAEMPKGLGAFGCIDGVWITRRESAFGLAVALRAGLLEVAGTRRTLQGRHSKMEYLYQFLTGPEFQQRVEGIIEAFAAMRTDLESERRSIQRLWAKRDKQLDRAMLNTSCLYGDLAGILGASLPHLDALELSYIPLEIDAEAALADKAPWD